MKINIVDDHSDCPPHRWREYRRDGVLMLKVCRDCGQEG